MPDWFGADRFERAFKSALKRCNIRISDKLGEDIYIVTNGKSQLEINTAAARRQFSRTRSQADADYFAEGIYEKLLLEDRLISFTNAQAFLRLSITDEKNIEKGMIYTDFAGTLKKTVCYSGDDIELHTLSESVLKRWSVPAEVLFSVADRNMGRILSKTPYRQDELGDGINVIGFEASGSPLTVSMLLCTDFRELMTDKLGERFMAAAPSMESMLAVQEISGAVLDNLGAAVVNDHRWADNPLSTDIFLFTPKGVTVAKHFEPAL